MFEIDVRSNLKDVQKNLDDIARKQIPQATAVALNLLAKDVQKAEKDSLSKTFDRPTPFTVNAIRMIPAKKNMPIATVFVMDTASEYLYPYEVGKKNKGLGASQSFYLRPVDRTLLNKFGNFPQNLLERLVGSGGANVGNRANRGLKPFPGKPGYFVGSVKTKKGRTMGLWFRTPYKAASKRNQTAAQKTGLRLLIAFDDPHPTKQHLDFGKRAEQIVAKNFNRRFGQALAKALATAK